VLGVREGGEAASGQCVDEREYNGLDEQVHERDSDYACRWQFVCDGRAQPEWNDEQHRYGSANGGALRSGCCAHRCCCVGVRFVKGHSSHDAEKGLAVPGDRGAVSLPQSHFPP
jgi:hypothetical protein